MSTKAVQEAQDVLKNIRDQCARAYQETKRCEAEAKEKDIQRVELEQEMQSACAEYAALEQDIIQQQSFLDEFPRKIQDCTSKTDRILGLWGMLDKEATNVDVTSEAVIQIKSQRLESATRKLLAAQQKLADFHVWKNTTLSEANHALHCALNQKAELEFQFANEKNTLACSEKVNQEASAFWEEQKIKEKLAETRLADITKKEVLLTESQQDELNSLHEENQQSAASIENEKHCAAVALADEKQKLQEIQNLCEAEEKCIEAFRKETVQSLDQQIEAKDAEHLRTFQKLADQLFGLVQEEKILLKEQAQIKQYVTEKAAQALAEMTKEITNQLTAFEEEGKKLHDELASLSTQLEMGKESRQNEEAAHQATISLMRENAAAKILKQQERAKLRNQMREEIRLEKLRIETQAKEMELERVRLEKEQEEAQAMAELQKQRAAEAKRIATEMKQEKARVKKEEALEKQKLKAQEKAKIEQAKLEEKLLKEKEALEKEERKREAAAATAAAAAAKKQVQTKPKEGPEVSADKTTQVAKAKTGPKPRKSRAQQNREEEAEDDCIATPQVSRLNRQCLKSAESSTQAEIHVSTKRIQSATPDWVRKQTSPSFQRSPLDYDIQSEQDSNSRKTSLGLHQITNNIISFQPRKSKKKDKTSESDSSGSQFDIFSEN